MAEPCRAGAGRGVRALLLCALAGCGSGAAPPREAALDSAGGELRFEMGGRGAAVVVPVHVNGEGPFDFALDTGATLTCVDQALAARLRLEEERGVRGVGAGMTRVGRLALVRLDSVRVGPARAQDLLACALDLRHTASVGLGIDGLLGLNFLKAFRVTLDFEREVLLLEAP